MFKSFFAKLALTYIGIVTAVILIFSYGTTLLYEKNILEDKKQNLLLAADEVERLAQAYYNDTISQKELDNEMNTIGAISESKIYIIKLTKESLKSPEKLQLEGLAYSSLIRDLDQVLDNKTVFTKNKYFKDMDTYVVMLGKPLLIQSKIEGAIIFLTPVGKLGSRIASIRLLVLLLAAIMALISITIIYFNTKKIAKPVKKLEQAAMKLAVGEHPEDIVIHSQDEIGSLAKTFNYMKNRLAETEQIRRDFIANVSHDLRTPLTTINGFVQAMLDGLVKPESTTKYLEVINKETLRLMRLTGDILELAKLESGSIRLHREYICAKEIFEDICLSMAPMADEKAICLTINCSETVRIYVDEDRLKQILSNVISNAIKYTNNGGNVVVEAEDEKELVSLSVRDNGIGIAKEELANIFEKFYRTDKSRRNENMGTGLGLSIVKKLVELHGGQINAESTLNAGTQITIKLPK